MKKLTALILTLVMLVSMTAIVPVSAAGMAIVPSENAIVVAPGESFSISWKTTTDEVIYGIDAGIHFDTAVFSYAHELPVFEESETYDRDYGYSVWFIGEETFTANQTIWTTTFTVSADAADGDYVIEVDPHDVDTEDEYYATDIEMGDVTVTVKTPSSIVEDTTNLKAEGYQIRVPYSGAEETSFGYRFVSKVDVTNYANYKELGTLVIPAEKLEGDLTVDTADVAKVVAEKFMSETTETVKQFNATMIDIKDANYAKDFTYRPYIVLEDDSIVYGEVATNNILETITGLYTELNAEQQTWVAENVPGFNA